MKLTTAITAIAIIASAGAASADQLAKAAGVEAGVYSTATLNNIISARESEDRTKLNFFLGQTEDSVRVSSRGSADNFDALINQAQSDDEQSKVAALKSLSQGDNFDGGVDYAALIEMAEADGDFTQSISAEITR